MWVNIIQGDPKLAPPLREKVRDDMHTQTLTQRHSHTDTDRHRHIHPHKHTHSRLRPQRNERYDEIVRYLRVKLSFLALKSTLLCLRGSRTTFKANGVDCDFGLTLNELGL